MNPKQVEALFCYEWRMARDFLGRANGDQQQAYLNLLTVLRVTVDSTDTHYRHVLLSVGAFMLRTWKIRRPIDSEGGLARRESA